ncbi:hypothetical protein GH5_04396 [Leishmania sp. Ghana 2012 LV757]|uniref:hypothetical protein n=1 Tax=Leishmania sp. Ghana 2012 LV757 TaxID=2803181 RepID=UPI001B646757|nr:hypothetical protein GH5_04396 [Leishmania sp. Ghana 2012 LV757]
MQPFSLFSRRGLCSGGLAAPAVAVAAVASPSTAIGYSACAMRWQSSRPYSRSSGGGRGSGSNSGPSAGSRGTGGFGSPRTPNGPVPRSFRNNTGDGELTAETRAALRDDSIVMAEVVKHIPPNGAISIKSLFSALDENIQEALSERHSGLRGFLEQRKQFFVLHTNPEDGVLYVICNPIIIQQYATRDVQRKTMRRMMGLDDDGRRQQQQRRPGGSHGGNRGRGGGGDRRYHGSPSSSGPSRPPQQQQQQQRSEGGSSSYGGRDGRCGFGGSSGGRGGGDGASRRGGPMGSHSQSFGTR